MRELKLSNALSEAVPASIQDWLREELAADRLKDGHLLIHHAGRQWVDLQFGAADKAQYWIASMTKPILSVATLLLRDAGKIALDDPVDHYLSGFGAAGVASQDDRQLPLERKTTIRDLLRHTSGLTYGQFGDGPIHQLYQRSKVYDFSQDNKQMAGRLCALPLVNQPGTTFEYGMSSDLLGRVIELICDMSLQDALNQLVLFPLGMRDTSFQSAPERLASIPSGFVRDAIAPPFGGSVIWQSGGAGLVSTARDYQAFALMLLGKGIHQGQVFLSSDSFAEMTQNALPEDVAYGPYTEALGITAPWMENGLGFGLGLAVRIGLSSHIPGGLGELLWPGVSGANFWVDPNHGLSVVFLTHAPEHRVVHRAGLRNAVYQSL